MLRFESTVRVQLPTSRSALTCGVVRDLVRGASSSGWLVRDERVPRRFRRAKVSNRRVRWQSPSGDDETPARAAAATSLLFRRPIHEEGSRSVERLYGRVGKYSCRAGSETGLPEIRRALRHPDTVRGYAERFRLLESLRATLRFLERRPIRTGAHHPELVLSSAEPGVAGRIETTGTETPSTTERALASIQRRFRATRYHLCRRAGSSCLSQRTNKPYIAISILTSKATRRRHRIQSVRALSQSFSRISARRVRAATTQRFAEARPFSNHGSRTYSAFVLFSRRQVPVQTP